MKLGIDRYNAYKNSHTSKGTVLITYSCVLTTIQFRLIERHKKDKFKYYGELFMKKRLGHYFLPKTYY